MAHVRHRIDQEGRELFEELGQLEDPHLLGCLGPDGGRAVPKALGQAFVDAEAQVEILHVFGLGPPQGGLVTR